MLLDEAVIYSRAAVNEDPRRLGALKDFFQVLTQAVAATPRACIVATLIASENEADDHTGAQVLRAFEDVFGRLQSSVEPVGREDLAEVLRRRLFENVPGEKDRRPIVDAALAAYANCKQLRDAQKDNATYHRLLQSYPFHPDLLEVFYEKWTELPKFQRTRGALRLLAQALKQSSDSDSSPFIGLEAFLGAKAELSPPVIDLVRICSDKDDTWTPKLVGELERAREAQQKQKTLSQREIEQAVLGVFLHSQPPGRRAENSDLYALLVHPGVDLAALETGLKEWRDLSWFLSEETSTWRLTTEPNLTHMHVNAVKSLPESKIAAELRSQIEKSKDLGDADKTGAGSGVSVHRLPQGPRDVPDNTDLHYLVLGPECAVDLGKPVPDGVQAFFKTTSGPQNPRVYRNMVVALAPDIALLAGLRGSVVNLLGWRSVEAGDAGKQLSPAQKKTLSERKKEVEDHLPSSVKAAYNVLLDLDDDGNVRAQALKSSDSLGITDTRPFAQIKAMLKAEERLLTGDLDPELLLPDSYYELWGPNETAKLAGDLLAAFAQFPRLPRFLTAQAFRETLAKGCEAGILALRLPRPDNTALTYWRVRPSNEELVRKELEVVPVTGALLDELSPTLLAPGALPGLWKGDLVTLIDLGEYFDGVRAPKLAAGVLHHSVEQAVLRSIVCARTPERSYLREGLPSAVFTDDLELIAPPTAITAFDFSPAAIPGIWSNDQATLAEITQALRNKLGYPPPPILVADAIREGIQKKQYEVESGVWPSGPGSDEQVVLRVPQAGANPEPDIVTPPPLPKPAGVLSAEATLTGFQLQKLGELVEQLSSAAPELKLSFRVLITAEGNGADPAAVASLNRLLQEVSNKLGFE